MGFIMCIINIGLLGDSLSLGLVVDFNDPTVWFNMQDHKGTEQYGFIDIFEGKKHKFLKNFNKELKQTQKLKNYLPRLGIRLQSACRSAMTIAHYNPAIFARDIPEQQYGPLYALSQASNNNLDLLIIAIGGADTQDFNAMTVETFLNALTDEEFNILLDELARHFPELASQIRQHTEINPTRQSNLLSKISISREINQAILSIAKQCNFKREVINIFIHDWGSKEYWNKTTNEMKDTITSMLLDYETRQHVDQRKYPFNINFILPPLMNPKEILYPSFHEIREKMPVMRSIITSIAEKNDYRLFDYNDIIEKLDARGVPIFGSDHLHLTSYFYKELKQSFQFSEILANVTQARLTAFLDQLSTNHKISDEDFEEANKELRGILRKLLNIPSVADYNSVLRDSPLHAAALPAFEDCQLNVSSCETHAP